MEKQFSKAKFLIDAIAKSPEDTHETCEHITNLVAIVTLSPELRENVASLLAGLISSESRNTRQNGYLALLVGSDSFEELKSQLQILRSRGYEENIRQEREGKAWCGQEKETLVRLLNQAGALSQSRKFAEAEKAYRELLVLAQKLGNIACQGTTFNHLGLVLARMGRLEEAIRCHLNAINILKQKSEKKLKD